MDGEISAPAQGGMALCLSGGGLRATLFHLGLVRALRTPRADGTVPLGEVREIYSVSGGSILAMHMLVNWDRYIGDEAAFAAAEQDLVTFAGRNIRDRILRRWVLTRWLGLLLDVVVGGPGGRGTGGRFSRTWWLQREYESFTRGRLFGEFAPGAATHRPRGHFLTTSFTTGELCSFSADAFEVEQREADAKAPPASAPCGHMRLSYAVAASSAFPPMFPPVALNDEMLAQPVDDEFQNRVSLSDGGVYDNLGIAKFLKQRDRGVDRSSRVLISDAGGSFRSSNDKSFRGVFSRNIRASDILMHRLSDDAKAEIAEMGGAASVVAIGTTVADPRLDVAIQQRLRLVRTDLDRFSPELAKLLIEHGERVGRATLGMPPAAPAPDSAQPASAGAVVERVNRIAARAANRSFVSLMVDFRDWTLLPILGLIGAFLFAAGWYVQMSRTAADLKDAFARAQAEAEKRVAEEQLRHSTDMERKLDRVGELVRAKDYAGLDRLIEGDLSQIRKQVTIDQQQVDKTSAEVAKIAEEQAYTPTGGAIHVAEAPISYPAPKVFIQFAGQLPRETIVSLNSRLRDLDWDVQSTSGERTPVAAGLNMVKFWGDNEDAAKRLADDINASGVLSTPVRAVRARDGGRHDHLEIWVSS